MTIYAEELRIIMDTLMGFIFNDGEEVRRDAVFRRLLCEIEVGDYPESVTTLCQQAANTWLLSSEMMAEADKKALRQSAVVYLLAAFGRLHALAGTEEYIVQRNKQQFGLR
ncbi:hypothetical protein [Kluyvera georgiana]|uniref:hypothetical protein n=1 Tax=Kluyvera georgiana TaxID=73098 RepID=UPI00321FF26F